MNPVLNPHRSRQSLLILLAILVIAAAIRLYLFRGFVGLDDAEYARIAYPTHGFYISPPPSWTPIWKGSTVSLFRVGNLVAAKAP